MLRKAKDLELYELRARDGKIGHVQDFFFDDQRWTVRYFVVDTGTWLNSRKVLISPVSVTQTEWNERLLAVNLTREQVENSPSVDTQQPVSREHEAALTQYYNWPAYWGAAGFPDAGFGMPIMPPNLGEDEAARARARREASGAAVHEDHHMRSVRAVTGHTIEATDGTIGHVDDFLLDDATWEIRYLVVDTRNWWPGKKVLIAPQWIDEVGWNEAKVYVQMTRQAIKGSPSYDPSKPLAPEYARALHDYYGQPWHGA